MFFSKRACNVLSSASRCGADSSFLTLGITAYLNVTVASACVPLARILQRQLDMAFRLRAEESVAHGLQRLAKKNLRAALDEMARTSPPSDEAIHEARTRLKKARAILHTIQVDDGCLNRDEKRLRKISRILSSLRDADAMEQVFVKLRDRDPQLFSEHTFARLKRQLQSHRREVMESAVRDRSWEEACRHLRKLRRAAKRWKPTHREFGALARALRTSHKDGRKAMARALKHQGARHRLAAVFVAG